MNFRSAFCFFTSLYAVALFAQTPPTGIVCKPSTDKSCGTSTISRVGFEGILDLTKDVEARHSPDPKKGGWHLYEGGCDIFVKADGQSGKKICVNTEKGTFCDSQIQDNAGELCDPAKAATHHDFKLTFDKTSGALLIQALDTAGTVNKLAPMLRVSGDVMPDSSNLDVELENVSKSQKAGSLHLTSYNKGGSTHEDFNPQEVLCGRYCPVGGLSNFTTTFDPKASSPIERTNNTTDQTVASDPITGLKSGTGAAAK
jgi:hypothetical protein